tara:strand:+ start:724249 stop:724476 length:228 start_codon:yes stop_codon:yes gene_type:complete
MLNPAQSMFSRVQFICSLGQSITRQNIVTNIIINIAIIHAVIVTAMAYQIVMIAALEIPIVTDRFLDLHKIKHPL